MVEDDFVIEIMFKTYRYNNSDTPRASQSERRTAARRGEAAPDGTPRERFARKTTGPRNLQGIEDTYSEAQIDANP